MLKIYLELKFLNIKSIAILKMQTKKLIKNGPGKI